MDEPLDGLALEASSRNPWIVRKALPWILTIAAVLLLLEPSSQLDGPPMLDEAEVLAPVQALPKLEAEPDNAVLNVEEVPPPPEGSPCPEPRSCIEGYLAFLEHAADHSKPVTEEELAAALDEAMQGTSVVLNSHPGTSELQAALAEAANIRFLLEGLAERPLQVAVLSEEETEDGLLRRLLLTDPFVGSFEALLLLPEGAGPHPAVVAHPGDSELAADFLRHRFGRLFPGRGMAILTVEPRANDGDRFENRATRRLLREGFTLAGLRVYETLLARKYLRWRAEIDGQRIGLLGHTEGSAVCNLAARLELGWAASVVDLTTVYASLKDDGMLLDESSPALFSWHQVVEDLQTTPSPSLLVEYDYAAGPEPILGFFSKQLDAGP